MELSSGIRTENTIGTGINQQRHGLMELRSGIKEDGNIETGISQQ